MLITNATLEGLRVTLNRDFMTGMQAQSQGAELFREVPSTTALNRYGWLGVFPKFREWVGPRQFNGLKERAYEIRNKTYEGSIRVDREQIEDNDIVEPRMIAQGLGARAATLRDDLLINLLQTGHTSKGYDGQFFFDTDHPTDLDAVSGTQQNYWASGMALTPANFDTVWSSMASLKGEDGDPLGILPNTLIVPPQLAKTARDIVAAETLANGATNTLNGVARVLTLSKLAAEPTAWYLAHIDGAMKPFILQNRRQVAVTSKFSLNDDNVFFRNEYLFGADARLGAGYGLWQLIAKAKA